MAAEDELRDIDVTGDSGDGVGVGAEAVVFQIRGVALIRGVRILDGMEN